MTVPIAFSLGLRVKGNSQQDIWRQNVRLAVNIYSLTSMRSQRDDFIPLIVSLFRHVEFDVYGGYVAVDTYLA